MIVNAPANRVGTVEVQCLYEEQGSQTTYPLNERQITFNGDLATVMGEETVKPQGENK
jgi:hypothetical protein